MLKYFKYFIFILIVASCSKEKASPDHSGNPIYVACYEKFLGDYTVWNPDSNNYYHMKVSHIPKLNIYDKDSLLIQGFANKFDLRVEFYCTVDSNHIQNGFDIGSHDTTYDLVGKRWYLFPLFQDTLGNKSNWLENDTLNLFFYMCNIKFYLHEGQPYFCKNVFHVAVKNR